MVILCLTVFLSVTFPSSFVLAFPGLGLSFAHSGETEDRLFFNDQVPAEVTKVRGGQSVTLHCSAGGSPSPTIHWLKNGARIPQVGTLHFYLCH